MSTCTFFGHHDCLPDVKPALRAAVIDLALNQSVDSFLVGNHGAFDRMVLSVLREMKAVYPHISYTVVLAYMPQKEEEWNDLDYSETMLPEGIELVPRRFAISWRNRWMLSQSAFVITCIDHSWGGAAQFAEMAERQKKTVIRLGKR